ncbi:MAG: tRNA 2-thiouridine(34) synthase MnmA [Elusimicrobiota bacterium]
MAKVIVAMSGGIDSSVTAFLLKKAGFEVIGITLRLFKKNSKCCGGDESIEKFKKICHKIGIKYYIKNAINIFEKEVVEEFVKDYISGKTPNPCVECNRKLKFEYLFNIAKSLGADFFATGHYAIVEKSTNGEYFLKRGIDKEKDQSYFLYPIKKEILPYIIFPLGNLLKENVKKIAQENNIPVNINIESKDICFIEGGNYSLWLKKNGYANSSDGYIKDTGGKILKKHNGLYNFTIGQRKKIGVSSTERLYVIDTIPGENTVIVGKHSEAFSKGMIIKNLNWFVDPIDLQNKKIYAQIRYRHIPKPGKLIKKGENNIEFMFNEREFAVTKGQSCVFYENDRVIGGGIIEEVIR